DAYYSSEERKLRFLDAMHSISKVTAGDVATAFDLSGFRTACDVGGCTGAMAYEFAKAYPGMSITVFDLPAVIELNHHFQPHDQDCSRVTFVAGDFFKDDLPKADLYILARILHDWSDDKVHILLRKLSEACSPGGAVLVSEILLEEGRRGPRRALLQALSMTPGSQRSGSEYCLLLKAHGFSQVHVRHTGNFLDAVLGTILDERNLHRSRSSLQSLNMLVQTEGLERSSARYTALLQEHGFSGVQLCYTGNFLDAIITFKM
ncbi:hypothetical protein Z043_101457, partial [Scleropages formosus]